MQKIDTGIKNNYTPRILVAFPTSDKKDYCVEDFIDQIKSFTYPNYDIFVVDNSKDESHVEMFWNRCFGTMVLKPFMSLLKMITLEAN
jgi:hypothetical protein